MLRFRTVLRKACVPQGPGNPTYGVPHWGLHDKGILHFGDLRWGSPIYLKPQNYGTSPYVSELAEALAASNLIPSGA